MDEIDLYFMRVSATHHELSLVADRMGRLAILGKGNVSDLTFRSLERRRTELNEALRELQTKIEALIPSS